MGEISGYRTSLSGFSTGVDCLLEDASRLDGGLNENCSPLFSFSLSLFFLFFSFFFFVWLISKEGMCLVSYIYIYIDNIFGYWKLPLNRTTNLPSRCFIIDLKIFPRGRNYGQSSVQSLPVSKTIDPHGDYRITEITTERYIKHRILSVSGNERARVFTSPGPLPRYCRNITRGPLHDNSTECNPISETFRRLEREE